MPPRLAIGLKENRGQTWMGQSGVPWDLRYMYLTLGWANNWGYSSNTGAYALSYMNECAAVGTLPTFSFYEMNDQPGGDETQFLAKTQNAATMNSYFSDFKLLMLRAKDFGKPVLVLLEPDGVALLEQQSADNPGTYAAVASTGLAELAGLPNTVAGWGLAFLQLRRAAGATNVILGMHISEWASGKDIAYSQVTDPLQPEVDKVYAFLAPLGLAANVTGDTYPVLVGDPLDRDSDYYRVVLGNPNRWWDPSDSASTTSRSFNRFGAWLKLWNQKAAKRWVLWQLPMGNSNALNVYNNGGARQGYQDNRAEYFFGSTGDSHRQAWAQDGVIALLFGAGAGGQMTNLTDVYTDGQPFLQNHAGGFLKAGGLPLTTGAAPPPTFSLSATATPSTVPSGSSSTVLTTVTATGAALSSGEVDVDVYNAAGSRVSHNAYPSQSFTSSATRTFTTAWAAPTQVGTYTVKLAVLGAGGAPSYAANPRATTLTVVPSDPAQYNFETSAQGWSVSGVSLGSATVSSATAYAGTHALAINFSGQASGTDDAAVLAPAVGAGQTVAFHVMCPTGAPVTTVQAYVMQGGAGGWSWTGTTLSGAQLALGSWNTLLVTVPPNAAVPLDQLGVEFTTSSPWTGACFVDSVRW